ncbi:helix-turn-helix domain-containing protein [Knoellia subterranea]|uniref:Excisionase n=1 Tax=Knoellia subterranea KCTC 19937 TaxID=1385521 RepID=A0A0A0JJG2_9MICO|nr:helix-turn-helix domain-containing protein [Knoellia subterranea]KGN37515.1 excisionase [Knoellia subterranea KCTC 19937]
MPATLEAKTYLPSALAELEAFHRDLDEAATSEFALVGPAGRVQVPAEVHAILVQVVEAMSEGKAITVTPNERILTTQEAADLLGVSRPTVVKLIESGSLPAERVSSRRKVQLRDVLAYRERRRQEQLDAIQATSLGVDDDAVTDRLAHAKAVRHEVAQRRRERIAARRADRVGS